MKNVSVRAIEGRFWRMVSVRFQMRPFQSGSHLRGGRWNAAGATAFYLASNPLSAVTEYFQGLTRPGTLAAYDVSAMRIVDLTDDSVLSNIGVDPAMLAYDWRVVRDTGNEVPATWNLAAAMIAAGADGALYPSAFADGSQNLVLWRWHDAATGGEGAAVTLIDPDGDLRRA